jgi:hypothetical protein
VTPKDKSDLCRLVGLTEALEAFVKADAGTEGQRHIKPMHWYVACRLVLEGGFRPEHIMPTPPFVVRRSRNRNFLEHDSGVATGGEATVFGGLKTKDVDVVVDIPGLGPCIAVSMKGTLNAFRNLTNRLEEAVGDCTNLHADHRRRPHGEAVGLAVVTKDRRASPRRSQQVEQDADIRAAHQKCGNRESVGNHDRTVQNTLPKTPPV